MPRGLDYYIRNAQPKHQTRNKTKDRKRKQHQYMFLSASFGLVSERTPLPNYDASFNHKSSEFLQLRSEELGLHESLTSLLKYDLIYLNLLDSYLRTIDFDLISSKTIDFDLISSNTTKLISSLSHSLLMPMKMQSIP